MARGNIILLTALVGAAVAAIAASYFTTESGRQMLNTATDALKDAAAQAKEAAKNNLGEVLAEVKNSATSAVKQKVAEQVGR
jgi:gas vesicle protein